MLMNSNNNFLSLSSLLEANDKNNQWNQEALTPAANSSTASPTYILEESNQQNNPVVDNGNIVEHRYVDHANETSNESMNKVQRLTGSTTNGMLAFGPVLRTSSSTGKGGVAVPFPIKLHEMLDRIEEDGLAHVVSWQPHGRCFVVHKQKEFVEHVMPTYFRQTKFASFQRQLNLYEFSRLTSGRDKGGYYHEFFLRGKKFLCHRIQRVKVKGTGVRKASSPETEPQFYSMPPVGLRGEQDQDELLSKPSMLNMTRASDPFQQFFGPSASIRSGSTQPLQASTTNSSTLGLVSGAPGINALVSSLPSSNQLVKNPPAISAISTMSRDQQFALLQQLQLQSQQLQLQQQLQQQQQQQLSLQSSLQSLSAASTQANPAVLLLNQTSQQNHHQLFRISPISQQQSHSQVPSQVPLISSLIASGNSVDAASLATATAPATTQEPSKQPNNIATSAGEQEFHSVLKALVNMPVEPDSGDAESGSRGKNPLADDEGFGKILEMLTE